ncbi:receptor-type tyrosine-protein phosphatase mu-like [Patiria miniata]|uniref:protein-tyrosine-phosphatase n=1 Tax=Patiria miniata TaxID=46514 RepID=A0A914AS86_PATMI|nr:receptor-type tyrosine-protein phosphatase mu-like [Patiria miniata]
MEDRLYFIFLFLLLGPFTDVSAIVDFTCITKPRIDIGSEDTYIAAYLHGGNAALSFARTINTYTSVDENKPLGLPSDHFLKTYSSSTGGKISSLRLPAAGGKTRIGAFACRARMMGGDDISIGTVIMSKTADFLPTRVSQTVNLGDLVNLTVTATDQARNETRWRKDGKGIINKRNGKLHFDFINTVSDSWIYEAHFAGERKKGEQALMRLIVRGCKENKWNLTTCESACPLCFNGGICDDRSGDCICPPGFSGDICETPEGPNRFGQSGSFGCDSAELGGGPTCAGMLFCLPDPYGCSCAAGYQGIDCDETCAEGFYGANCEQRCHCADGVSCNATTGECRGNCAPGYTGINCQEKLTFEDFTCVTKPRIDIGSDKTYIAAYLHSGHAELSFARTTYTYTSVDNINDQLGLPSGHRYEPTSSSEGDEISILRLPAAGGKTRIGAFACNAMIAGSGNVSIGTVIMSKTAHILPTRVSQMVNLGDAVYLAVSAKDKKTRWRKDGGAVYMDRNDDLYFDFVNASVADTGIYEAHFAGKRSDGKQALMRLIVRGCKRNKWNPPLCNADCPVCFNGGVCDDRSGECICPPGFIGDFCGIPEGPNRFGQSGSFRCGELGGGPTCAGMLFCLPDPYGCSCAAGYQGIDCGKTCAAGFYGADCAQTCHCMNGVACNRTTGKCPGDCAPGFTGINCQACDDNRYGQDCRLCHCMDGVACDRTTGECFGDCAPGFTGLNCQENCLPNNEIASCGTTCTEFLDPATTSLAPGGVQSFSSFQNDSIRTFHWHPVNCPNGNIIVNYAYKFGTVEGEHEAEAVRTEGNSVSVHLPLCSTLYGFEVAAETTKGIGPFSLNKIVTPIWKVPDTVGGLTDKGTSHNTLSLSWGAPGTSQEHPCPASDYLVTFDLINLEQCREVREYGGSLNTTYTNDTSITLKELKAYSTYNISVTPRNEAGKGTTSFLQVTTGETYPLVSPGFISSSATTDSITWTWNPIPCGSRGGNITGYKTSLTGGPVGIDTRYVSTTSVTHTGLRPCTNYTLSVRAYTSVGYTTGRPNQSTQTQRTGTVVPDYVSDISVLATSRERNEFDVHWTSSEGPCPATSYNVTYELITMDQCMQQNPPIITDVGTVDTTYATLHLPAYYSKYRVNVAPINEAGHGEGNFKDIVTNENVPSASPVIRGTATNDSITFSWDPIPCGSRRGNITHYEYRFKGPRPQEKGKTNEKSNISKLSVTFRDLSPCTTYSIRVRAFTRIGAGLWANWTHQDTVVIDEIQSFNLDPSTNEIRTSWTTAGNEDNPCPVTSYRVSYQLLNLEQCQPRTDLAVINKTVVNGSDIEFTSMHAYSTYNVQVVPANNAGAKYRKSKTVTTDEGVPLAAPVVDTMLPFNQSVRVSWHPIPCGKRGGNITGYTYELRDASGSMVKTANTTAESVEVDGLSQGASYLFRLRAFTRVGPGPWKEGDFEIPKDDAAAPTPPGSSPAGSVLGVVVFILVAAVLALLIAVVVKKRRKQRTKALSKDSTGDGVQDIYGKGDQGGVELKNLPSTSGYKPYATKGHEPVVSSTNPPKSTDQVPVDVLPKAGPSTDSASASGPSTSTKAPVKPKPYVNPASKPKLKASAKASPSFPQAGPVAMAHLAEYIKSRTAGKINGFQQDYESIPGEPIHPWTVAKQDHNKKNNRYNNILAYDHSRVVLECLEDNPHSDYINASYINGYKQDYKYIASQGPTKASVKDMWRMVWQERVGKIVMLTNLIEHGKGKCEQYWPDDIADYGELFVRNVDETKHANFIVRTFHVSKSTEPEGEYRELTQFHYTTWPDMKPPESSPLLQFVRTVRATDASQHGPIVVHCSAGVGRTGTFITLDSMLEMAEAEGQVDVLKFVRDMRNQRFLMVQTLDQYKFIFDALLESSLSENTAISADRFHQSFAKLKKRDKKAGTTGIEAQFQMLESFTASPSEEQCMGGRSAANVDKNRFKDCVPKDSTRPYLMTKGDEGSTNYINATFLDGYNSKHAYLATQAPLPNTRGDMWRMVFDYKASCIVMLNSMDNDPSVVQYWPEKDSLEFGPLTVTLTNEDRYSEDIIIRQFDVSYPARKNDEVQSVCQIQYLGWPPGKEVPRSPSSLLKVLEAVKMWTTDHPDGPITVHCIDGVGCSGTFCAILTLLDQLAVEKDVDVFQAIKKLRITRAGMVNTLAQYQLCYQVIQTYLDSDSIYENY